MLFEYELGEGKVLSVQQDQEHGKKSPHPTKFFSIIYSLVRLPTPSTEMSNR